MSKQDKIVYHESIAIAPDPDGFAFAWIVFTRDGKETFRTRLVHGEMLDGVIKLLTDYREEYVK